MIKTDLNDIGNKGYIVVAGGINIDIGARSNKPIIMEDSNPGMISVGLGGVGRNIAHNLSKLGCNVKLISAIGDDNNAELVKSSCKQLGIDISDSYYAQNEPSSTYLFINRPDGDMAVAVNDMRICEHLTPEFFKEKLDIFNRAGLVIIDANLPKESIEYIANNVTAPIYADVVSTVKAMNVKPVIGKLHTLKGNRIEASHLAGIEICDEKSLRQAAQSLLDTGLKRVYISLGKDGMYAATGDEYVNVPAYETTAISTTGAGDSAMAAIAFASFMDLPLKESAKCANYAASLTISSKTTVSDKLNGDVLLEIL